MFFTHTQNWNLKALSKFLFFCSFVFFFTACEPNQFTPPWMITPESTITSILLPSTSTSQPEVTLTQTLKATSTLMPTITPTSIPTSTPTPTPTPSLNGPHNLNSLNYYKDNFAAISQNTNLSYSSISQNLVKNGDFEITDLWDTGWEPLTAIDSKWNSGDFETKVDSTQGFQKTKSLKISGRNIETKESKQESRGGIRRRLGMPLYLSSKSGYLISFLIQTKNIKTTNQTNKILGVVFEGSSVLSNYIYIDKKFDNCWGQVIIFATNSSAVGESVIPYFMLFTEGDIWIDNLNIRRVDFSDTTSSISKFIKVRTDVIEGVCTQ